MDYQAFLETKQIREAAHGKQINKSALHQALFPFQADIVEWACRKGRAAVFADTGMGKTPIQLEWTRTMGENTLIIAPLSVARQTVQIGRDLLGLDVRYVRSQDEITHDNLWITNYEMIDHFDFSQFGAVVLDESSILKALTGKTRRKLVDLCKDVPYRLCCSATPAPNDYTEIGNHAEFLGICSMAEMLAMFFINANKEHTFSYGDKVYRKKGSNKGGQEWRLKHHAETPFFRWMSSWAMCLTKPSDLGYDDDGFILPPLNIQTHYAQVNGYQPEGQLFFTGLGGIRGRSKIRGETIGIRLEILRSLVNPGNSVYNDSNKLPEGDKHDRRPGIPETILSGEQGTEAETSQRAQSKHDAGAAQEAQGIHAPISKRSSRKMEEDSRAEGPNQCAPSRALCSGQTETNTGKGADQGMAEEQSPETQGSTAKRVWADHKGIRADSEETTGEMCDLRSLRCERSELLSPSGPLPRDWESSRAALYELQSWDREVPGQPSSFEGSSQLSGEQWVIWCGLNSEQDAVAMMLGDKCVSIYGSLSVDEKISLLDKWFNKEVQFLVTKGRICGFGLNLQQAHHMAFFGLNDSWELWYQCIRREWRFMQEHPVDVHVIMSDLEAAIYQNVQRKDAMASRLRRKMIEHIRIYEEAELQMREQTGEYYNTATVKGENWTAMLGDSSERLKEIESDSVDLSVYSPPFADLYTYTNSERDLGNCRDWDEFFGHYAFIIREVLRVTKPGRLTCVHTSDIPALAQKDGYIGIKDFPGEVIRAYEREGWVFHGRAFVQKNPQAQAIRTHSQGLLFVQLDKDSSKSHPCLIDQILIFRKEGENAVPVRPVENGEMDNEIWIEWANGIWTGIRETETLQFARARDGSDEKHVCPLQLETIERCIKLYSNPGETVLTPFGGIGSEGYVALMNGRKAICIELKESYFAELLKNLRAATVEPVDDLFSLSGVEVEDAHLSKMEIV